MSVDVMISQPMAPSVGQAKPSANQPLLIGKSPVIIEILRKADLVAKSQAPVLITGESGTGKDILTHIIHSKSDRRDRELVAINCAALPKDVIDNELFGHEREAFTGAASRRQGCFEQAHLSTLFLDEIAEMHPQSQAKLLRAIESKTFRRLGGREVVTVDARIIAATNKRIEESLKSGVFREDLYYRLGVIEITMPALLEHREDVPLLVRHFLWMLNAKYAIEPKSFSKESIEILCEYHWPGNVRELKNVVERAVLISPEEIISPEHLPSRVTSATHNPQIVSIPVGTSLEETEIQMIKHTLRAYGNNKSKTAQVLGLSRKTLYDKLNKITFLR